MSRLATLRRSLPTDGDQLLDLSRPLGRFAQRRHRRVGHALGPDVKPTTIGGRRQLGRHLPHAPDSLPFVVPFVIYVVPADVVLVPAARAIGEIVIPIEGELADAIAPGADNLSIMKVQAQLPHAPPRNRRLNPKSGPWTARKARIGFQVVGQFRHDLTSCRCNTDADRSAGTAARRSLRSKRSSGSCRPR